MVADPLTASFDDIYRSTMQLRTDLEATVDLLQNKGAALFAARDSGDLAEAGRLLGELLTYVAILCGRCSP